VQVTFLPHYNGSNDDKGTMVENRIGKFIVEKEVQIHKVLSPGLLETVYPKNRSR
jgi:hypothetical protein